MALNFYNTVDLQENQLLRAAINNVSGEPADGARGELLGGGGVIAICAAQRCVV